MTKSLPVIDLGPFLLGDRSATSVVEATQAACRDTGFFIVTGHGVSPQTIANLSQAARDFFDLAEDEKLRTRHGAEMTGGLDFSPMQEEALAATLGINTPGDAKECLNFGPRLGGRAWPARPASLKPAFAAYYAAMERLARDLRRLFCSAIGLPPDYFEADFAEHLSALRVINYPPQMQEPLPGQLRAGVHTDYGFMTILRSESTPGGLQVQQRDGAWVDAPAVENAFVINIADAFMRWTNDAWVSTPHRVANPPRTAGASARRQSIPFFVNPSKATRIACLAPFCSPEHPAKYEPITYGEYIALKTRQAFAHTM